VEDNIVTLSKAVLKCELGLFTVFSPWNSVAPVRPGEALWILIIAST
jgi:hypothetical protein